LSYSLDETSIGKGISLDNLGRLRWNPEITDVGNHVVTVTVTDEPGAATSESFQINVVADTEAPQVDLQPVGTIYVVDSQFQTDLNSTVSFQAWATDNVGVTGLQLLVNNTPVILEGNGIASIEFKELGTIELKARAYDAVGNVGEAVTTVDVYDSSDVDAPTVELDLGDVADNTVTGPIEIKGTIDDSNLDYYVLEVAPVGSDSYREIRRGNSPVTEDVIASFDPSTLANDAYNLRLTAVDSGNNQATVSETIYVEGDLKLGNFQLSFTDLTIPVAGIPVTVTRTYDSLIANQQDDFGFGWRLEFRDTNLRTSLGKDENLEAFDITSKGFREGDKVYLTLPGGERETYIFKPQLTPAGALLQALGSASSLGATEQDFGLYEPAFVSQSDSNNQLEVETATLIRSPSGEFTGIAGGLYNPAANYYGGRYTLTTDSGIVYDIDADTGDLLTARDTNGNELNFSDAGITSDSGVEVRFGRDAQGRITRVIDPEGNEIGYEYDESGDLVGVTDREGNRTGFGYSEVRAHYLDEIIDPLGRSGVRTEYDENGRLSRVLDVNGEAVELVYDLDNSTQTVRDVFGNPTTYVYDERGNVLTEVNAVGLVTERTYDGNDNLLTETVISDESGEDGYTTSYSYDERGNVLTRTDPLGAVYRNTYNGFGQILTETDALGNTTSYSYDGRGNLLSTRDAAGSINSFSYDGSGNLLSLIDAAGNTTSFSYDRNGNVVEIVDALGNATSFSYDRNGVQLSSTQTITTANGVEEAVTSSSYDSNENLLSETNALQQVTTYEYDANGSRTAVIDALGRRTEYRYNEKGQLIETIYPDNTPSTNQDNPRSITLYDRGNRERVTINREGNAVYYEYDPLDRLVETIYSDGIDTLSDLVEYLAPEKTLESIDWTEIVYPDNSPSYLENNPRTGTEYHQNGGVKATIDEGGNRTEYRYNGNGQLLETITPELADYPGERFSTTYSYDVLGRQISSTDALGRTTRFIYDELGRLVETQYADGTSTMATYDNLGRRVAATDQEGKITSYEYDAAGRLTDVVQLLEQSSNNPIEVRTEYGYNELGNLIWTEDAKDHRTQFEYDLLGRRIGVELPEGQRSSTVYDAVGNVASTTDFNGDTTTYTYDEQNRLILEQFSDDTTISYTYTGNGLRETVTDSRGTVTYEYDKRNRLIARTEPNTPYTANGKTIEYSYDILGNRTEVITPSGTVSYGFDQWNRLKMVTDWDGDITTYFYDPVGNLRSTEFANGVVETREYDDLNRLVFLENSLEDEVISSYRYVLNKVGHRLSVEEDDGRVVEYEYDDLYRLVEERIIDLDGFERIISYTHDLVGNRLEKNDSVERITTYSYDGNDLLLEVVLSQDGEVVSSNSYFYDDNGNTIKEVQDGTEETVYIWDKRNRLVRVILPDGKEVFYVYDADNIRVASQENGVTTQYIVDSNRPYAQVLEEYVDGELVVRYVYGLDLISQERNGEELVYLVDGLGSTRVLTDSNGAATNSYTYDAFGELIDSTVRGENDYLFAGEQYDGNLDKYYLRQRYYDTWIGRFTRRDTYEGDINNPVSLHKYLYGNADPVNGTDPSGLVTLSEIAAARHIRNVLAEIQFDSYSYLVEATLGGEDSVDDAIFTNLAFASTFPLIGAVTRSLSSSLPGIIRAGGWLSKHEGVIGGYTLGHSISRHVAKTDADLLARLASSPGITAASTFTNQTIAENVISQTIQANRNEIRTWLRNPSANPRLRLYYVGDGSTIVGRGINQGSTVANPLFDARVVLKKHPNPQKGYFILTAFPDNI